MLANLMSGLSLAFNNAKRSTLSSESHRGPEGEWVGLTLAASERNRRSSFEWWERARERRRGRGRESESGGCGVRVGALRAPHSSSAPGVGAERG